MIRLLSDCLQISLVDCTRIQCEIVGLEAPIKAPMRNLSTSGLSEDPVNNNSKKENGGSQIFHYQMFAEGS